MSHRLTIRTKENRPHEAIVLLDGKPLKAFGVKLEGRAGELWRATLDIWVGELDVDVDAQMQARDVQPE